MILTHIVAIKLLPGAGETSVININIGNAISAFNALELSITFPGGFITIFQSIYQSVFRKIKEL